MASKNTGGVGMQDGGLLVLHGGAATDKHWQDPEECAARNSTELGRTVVGHGYEDAARAPDTRTGLPSARFKKQT